MANKATQVPNQNRGHLSTSRLLKMRSISASGASSSSSLCRRRASIWTPAGFLLTLQIPLLGHTCCGLPLGGGARHLFALRPPILGTPYRKDFSPVPRAEIFYSFIWHYSPPPIIGTWGGPGAPRWWQRGDLPVHQHRCRQKKNAPPTAPRSRAARLIQSLICISGMKRMGGFKTWLPHRFCRLAIEKTLHIRTET